MLGASFDEAIQPASGHFYIAVEQDHPIEIQLRPQDGKALIVTAGKTVVLGQGHGQHRRRVFAKPLQAAIRGSIVDQHDTVLLTSVGHHGRQKALQVVQAIPVQDGHGNTTRIRGCLAHGLNAG